MATQHQASVVRHWPKVTVTLKDRASVSGQRTPISSVVTGGDAAIRIALARCIPAAT